MHDTSVSPILQNLKTGHTDTPELQLLDGVLCPRCAYPGPHIPGPGAGPHHARLVCGQCGAFLRWLPKPRSAAQEG